MLQIDENSRNIQGMGYINDILDSMSKLLWNFARIILWPIVDIGPHTPVSDIYHESRVHHANRLQKNGPGFCDSDARRALDVKSALQAGYVKHKCGHVRFDLMSEAEAKDFLNVSLKDVPPPQPNARHNLQSGLYRARRENIDPVHTPTPSQPVHDDIASAQFREKRRTRVNYF